MQYQATGLKIVFTSSIMFSCTQRSSIVGRCRGTERLISSLSSTLVLSLSPYQREKWREKWEQEEIMHIGDIYFPFFFPDNGLLFQALLSAVFACGMISITKDGGMQTCSHFKTTSAPLWRWKLTPGKKKPKKKTMQQSRYPHAPKWSPVTSLICF